MRLDVDPSELTSVDVGQCLCWILAMNITQTGLHKKAAKSRKNQFGRPSGPGALRTLIPSSRRKTVSTETVYCAGTGSLDGVVSSSGCRSSETAFIFFENSAYYCLCFAKFRPQFSNLVAPSTDGSAKCLVHYKVHMVP